MNRDDIICMAREAGAMPVVELAGCWITYDEPLQRFAALVAAAEREEIYELVMFEPLKKDADLLMPESEVEENPFDDYFKSAEFRNSINNAVKATLFTICSEIKKRGQA